MPPTTHLPQSFQSWLQMVITPLHSTSGPQSTLEPNCPLHSWLTWSLSTRITISFTDTTPAHQQVSLSQTHSLDEGDVYPKEGNHDSASSSQQKLPSVCTSNDHLQATGIIPLSYHPHHPSRINPWHIILQGLQLSMDAEKLHSNPQSNFNFTPSLLYFCNEQYNSNWPLVHYLTLNIPMTKHKQSSNSSMVYWLDHTPVFFICGDHTVISILLLQSSFQILLWILLQFIPWHFLQLFLQPLLWLFPVPLGPPTSFSALLVLSSI